MSRTKLQPTREQIIALQRYALKYGRTWKSKLSAAWANGGDEREPDGGLLRQVRNTFGPSWLMAFKFPEDLPPPTMATAAATDDELKQSVTDFLANEDDSDDEDTEDDDDGEGASRVHVTSAVVRSPSDLIDADATTRALRALGIEGDHGHIIIGRSDVRKALLAALEGGE